MIRRPITQSPSHPVTQSPSHPVTQSPNHPITQSPNHPVSSRRAALTALLASFFVALLGNVDGGGQLVRKLAALSGSSFESNLPGVETAVRDERLTSVEADRMIRALDLPKRKRENRGLRDAMAAVVLLDDYLREAAE